MALYLIKRREETNHEQVMDVHRMAGRGGCVMARRFKHDDRAERALPTRSIDKYDGVDFSTCHVATTVVDDQSSHYRPTLSDVTGSRDACFALGMTRHDRTRCRHIVTDSPDRFGFARCARCTGWLWSAGWVADGVYSEFTVEWATNEALRYSRRLVGRALEVAR